MPDDERFGVLWMATRRCRRRTTSTGLQRRQPRAAPGTDPESVVDRVDRLLEGYGGVGAYARADQISNWFLMSEIAQHRTLSTICHVFLAVAAFLTHMVMDG